MSALDQRFRKKISNVAFLVEDEPDSGTLEENDVARGDTLLGLYHGIPRTQRGSEYGVGVALPDTITLFQRPIEEAAREDSVEKGVPFEEAVRRVVADTVWHEVAHHFGLGEEAVNLREREREKAIEKAVEKDR